MEENKEKQEKMTYEQLEKTAGDLYQTNQKLVAEIRKLQNALRSMDRDSYFLNMLFRVIEHPEMYDDEFVKWTATNIRAAVTSFAEELKRIAEEENKEANEAK